MIGRSQEPSRRSQRLSKVFRLAKYAIRPLSTLTEPARVPLTAFIVEDMDEFVHAHATYRFVIMDEEEERPRILVGSSICALSPILTRMYRYGCLSRICVSHIQLLPNMFYPRALQSMLQRFSSSSWVLIALRMTSMSESRICRFMQYSNSESPVVCCNATLVFHKPSTYTIPSIFAVTWPLI